MGTVPEGEMRFFRRPGALLASVTILVLGLAFVFNLVPYRQILDQQRRVDGARATLARLQAENAQLQEEADALHTDTEIERLARDKLGYVRPGEVAFVVLEPPPELQSIPEEPPPPPPADERAWYQKVWDFMTGRDLASD